MFFYYTITMVIRMEPVHLIFVVAVAAAVFHFLSPNYNDDDNIDEEVAAPLNRISDAIAKLNELNGSGRRSRKNGGEDGSGNDMDDVDDDLSEVIGKGSANSKRQQITQIAAEINEDSRVAFNRINNASLSTLLECINEFHGKCIDQTKPTYEGLTKKLNDIIKKTENEDLTSQVVTGFISEVESVHTEFIDISAKVRDSSNDDDQTDLIQAFNMWSANFDVYRKSLVSLKDKISRAEASKIRKALNDKTSLHPRLPTFQEAIHGLLKHMIDILNVGLDNPINVFQNVPQNELETKIIANCIEFIKRGNAAPFKENKDPKEQSQKITEKLNLLCTYICAALKKNPSLMDNGDKKFISCNRDDTSIFYLLPYRQAFYGDQVLGQLTHSSWASYSYLKTKDVHGFDADALIYLVMNPIRISYFKNKEGGAVGTEEIKLDEFPEVYNVHEEQCSDYKMKDGYHVAADFRQPKRRRKVLKHEEKNVILSADIVLPEVQIKQHENSQSMKGGGRVAARRDDVWKATVASPHIFMYACKAVRIWALERWQRPFGSATFFAHDLLATVSAACVIWFLGLGGDWSDAVLSFCVDTVAIYAIWYALSCADWTEDRKKAFRKWVVLVPFYGLTSL
jgi:hypothetical protein